MAKVSKIGDRNRDGPLATDEPIEKMCSAQTRDHPASLLGSVVFKDAGKGIFCLESDDRFQIDCRQIDRTADQSKRAIV
jgi:hypothetical protein